MKSTLPSVSSLQKTFHKLCDPSKLYLLFSGIGVIVYLVHFIEHTDKMYTMGGLVAQVLFTLLWTYVLNYVCTLKKYGGVKLAWFLLLVPFVLFLILLVFILYMLSQMSENVAADMIEEKDKNGGKNKQ